MQLAQAIEELDSSIAAMQIVRNDHARMILLLLGGAAT